MNDNSNDAIIDEAEKLLQKLNLNGNSSTDVLIVDDVRANIFLMETILSDTFKVESVQSAAMMWKRLNHHKPKVILLDLMMPYEDGFEVLKKLQQDENLKSIPVIVVSAKDAREDVVKALSMGAKDYIVKPVTEDLLLNKIADILNIDINEISDSE